MKLVLTFLFLLLPLHIAHATAADFPQGNELTDIASPAEIYSEMLEQGIRSDDAADFSAALTSPREAAVYVYVKKSQQHLWVYENGKQISDWAVSTGTEQDRCPPSGECYFAHTPTGVFTPESLHYTYTSHLWEARMDRAIFITSGIALHATYGEHIRMLGRRDSGGCVRQHPVNADYLFRLVSHYGRANTRVQIVE
ncbi:MAG: L,D-transpeptidase [Bdellovibrionota bacterium]